MWKKRWIMLASGAAALMLVAAAVAWVLATDRMTSREKGRSPDGASAALGQAEDSRPAARTAGRTTQMEGAEEPDDPEKVETDVYVSEPSTPTVSPAVRDLPEIEVDPLLAREMLRRDTFGFIGEGVQGPAWLDPLVETQRRAILAEPKVFSTPLTNWAGMDYNSYPPDTTGDVGPNHYVQAVNGPGGSTVQIFDKSGTSLKTFTMDSLSNTAPCNNGFCDPIVIYDSLADRWLISEFSATSGYAFCIYVSTTADPTGTWYAYTWDLPYYDYPKYGVWPDAYYMGYNGGPTGYRQVFAFDRAKMLAGQTATYQMFSAPSLSGFGFQLLVPASWEGPTPPPAGLGGLFARPNDTEVNGPAGYGSIDFLEMYEFDVNWTTPANSTLTRLPNVAIGEYDATLCGTGSDWSCMPQPDTTQALDPIREPLHQPLQYRNWGGYETLVGGFAEDVNGADMAAVRWFELRQVNGAWSVYQEGVVGGGDAHHRSVTSVAMDGSGGIGLGYTLTSSTVYPSIRYAGRRPWDPPGTMAYVDVVAQAGTGSQASYDRWGDYSGIGIDPADDCTFWYTTEYMLGSSSATRVISFRHDADFNADATPNLLDLCAPADGVYTVTTAKTCAITGAVTMNASGLPANTTASWSANPVTPPGSATLTIGNTGAAAAGAYDIVVSGASGSITHQEMVVLNLATAAPGPAALSTPADGATGAATTPTLTWQALDGAASYAIEVATDPGFTDIVRSATGLTGTSYVPSPALNTDTVYYWRVKGSNACGAGSASPTWAFRTAATSCRTYNSTDIPKTINDLSWAESTLTVTDSFNATDVDVIINQINHSRDQHLDIYIRHPDGGDIELSTDNGGNSANYTDTRFDDEATTVITDGTAPFTGSFRPEGSLTTLDNKSVNGTWGLRIYDDTSGRTGSLTAWSMVICGAGSPPGDYSDLASGYGIAWHTGDGSLRLGNAWTADSSFAAGNDNASDDGVTFPSGLTAGQASTVRVTVQGTPANGRWLKLWFDWNGDGAFSDLAEGELVYSDSVVDGANDITVNVPAGQTAAPFYRARLYDAADGVRERDTGSYGAASGGEVEDGQGLAPTAIDLLRFEAWPEGNTIRVQWETTSEIDTLGFNLYRGLSTRAPKARIKLNDTLIPTNVPPGSPFGATYDWVDAANVHGDRTYTYWLEEVDTYGGLRMYGPIEVTTPK